MPGHSEIGTQMNLNPFNSVKKTGNLRKFSYSQPGVA